MILIRCVSAMLLIVAGLLGIVFHESAEVGGMCGMSFLAGIMFALSFPDKFKEIYSDPK